MDRIQRQVGAATKKLRNSKSAAETLAILAELKEKKPEVYKALKAQRGN